MAATLAGGALAVAVVALAREVPILRELEEAGMRLVVPDDEEHLARLGIPEWRSPTGDTRYPAQAGRA